MTAGTERQSQLFFSVRTHKIELSFEDDECQQFILTENLLFCFRLKGAILAHKEDGTDRSFFLQNPPLNRACTSAKANQSRKICYRLFSLTCVTPRLVTNESN